jgi:hypothetical protein
MIVQGVVKPAPGLDFASKPDASLGSIASLSAHESEVRSAPMSGEKADILVIASAAGINEKKIA